MKDAIKRKRLGQYFSGSKVADLLVDLCSLTGSEFVIDPMAGVGDMLVAAMEAGVSAGNVSGIEIDPEAGNQCKDRIVPGSVVIGDAFSPETHAALGRSAWDLVITNPPYVRYQSMSGFNGAGIHLKSSAETRLSLSAIVNRLEHLTVEEKMCFQRIIRHYSGLSDLAVPAWILCAALTRVGGRLAMVVPESWISRDYALAIKYMLLKFFTVECIVEDWHSVWFPDALVKTNLLVAKRVRFRESLTAVGDLRYQHIRLGAELIGDTSLIEKLESNGQKGRTAFLRLLSSDKCGSGDGYENRHICLSSLLSEMIASQAHGKLLVKLEPYTEFTTPVSVPKELQDVLGQISSSGLADLGAWGFQVGQGLRTGANKFFYTELLKTEGDVEYLVTNRIFGERTIPVAKKYALPAFRYQSDIRNGFIVTKAGLPHRLLYIQEDFCTADGTVQNTDDAPLAEHIAIAENTPIESNGRLTRFPELSAVKPNIREASSQSAGRQWFMLPALANRHMPQLCISRVNYKNARCCLVAEDGIVVDANFSTLWTVSVDKQTVDAMFALLNSTWTKSYWEAIATVMGGGALKLEASHIRKLLLPKPTDALIASLALLGKRLAENDPFKIGSTINEIDRAVLKALLGQPATQAQCDGLRDYLQAKINSRQR
ncbi:MAG: N-6 DNA methylase [Bacillota bacterium]